MEASAILPTLPLISRSIHRLPTPSTYRLLFLSRQPSSSLSLSTRRFSNLLRSLSPLTPSPTPNPLFDTRAHSSFGDGGGDDAGGVGPGSGGGGGGGGGEAGTKPIAAGEGEDIASLGSDAIILDVGGMSCGGCVASVKRILESQPQVSSASVNLATETAVVWAVPEAKVTQNWKQQLGEKLATHLTTCGFKSNLRDTLNNISEMDAYGDILSLGRAECHVLPAEIFLLAKKIFKVKGKMSEVKYDESAKDAYATLNGKFWRTRSMEWIGATDFDPSGLHWSYYFLTWLEDI